MTERETWYVLEDGTIADPREVERDAAGVLRHRDGVAVAIGAYGPRSRSVAVDPKAKDMRPAASGPGYLTREADGAGDDLSALRDEYRRTFGKQPFYGWDAAALREKIAAR